MAGVERGGADVACRGGGGEVHVAPRTVRIELAEEYQSRGWRAEGAHHAPAIVVDPPKISCRFSVPMVIASDLDSTLDPKQ